MAWNDQRNTSKKKKKKKDQAISHGDCNDLVTSPLWKHHFSSSFQRKLIDGFWYFLPAPTIFFFFKVLATHCHWVVLPVHGSILELPGANKWKAGSRWLVFTHMNKTFKIFSLLYWCIKKHKHQRKEAAIFRKNKSISATVKKNKTSQLGKRLLKQVSRDQ